MRVVATALGVYENRRIREGEAFTLKPIYKRDKSGKVEKDKNGKPTVLVPAEKLFSERWMAKLSDHKKALKAKEEAEELGLDEADESGDVI
jgi:ribosomal protein S17